MTLPDGIEDGDYEAIEAAVAETVRGRWFLNEYARRCRAAEIGLVLEAVARVETAVSSRPADVSAGERLLLARAGEVAGTLRALAADLQGYDLPPELIERVESAARAAGGLAPAETRIQGSEQRTAHSLLAPAIARSRDPRALDRWDTLPLPEKLALFI